MNDKELLDLKNGFFLLKQYDNVVCKLLNYLPINCKSFNSQLPSIDVSTFIKRCEFNTNDLINLTKFRNLSKAIENKNKKCNLLNYSPLAEKCWKKETIINSEITAYICMKTKYLKHLPKNKKCTLYSDDTETIYRFDFEQGYSVVICGLQIN